MTWLNPSWRRILLLLLSVVLSIFLVFSLTPVALTQTNPFSELVRRIQALIQPTLKAGPPTGRTKGGAGRGPLCSAIDTPITALVPVREESTRGTSTTQLVWGTTVEQHPTLWFYVPYQAAEVLHSAKFMLLDADKHPLLDQPILIPLSGTPGIIEFRLPYKLEIDKLYNWYFSIVCDAGKPSRNPDVRGWIQLIAMNPQLSTALLAAAPLHKYVAYAEQGIWYDTVTYIATERRSHPEDKTVQDDWTGLLNFLNLQDLVDAPIVNCCTSEK